MVELIKKWLVGILFVVCLVGLPALADTLDNYYTIEGTITRVSKDNLVRVTDTTGMVYCFSDEGYFEGQNVKVKFNNNDTPTREDDKIVKVTLE